MKAILISIILMSLTSTGLCIKCYVGTGNVNSSSVKEEDGFKTCTFTIAIDGITSSFIRAGVNTTETTGCQDLDDDEEGVKSRLCHCNTELCNNATNAADLTTGETIKCYVGNGNVGSHGIKEVDGYKTCAVSIAVVGVMKIITRSGLPLMINTSCVEEEGENITDTIYYCNTDLCNSQGSTIKCYVGVGNVGSRNVKEIEGYETCSVSTYVTDGIKVITRAGSLTPCLEEEQEKGANCTSCLDAERNGATERICHCDTDLCNSEGSTVKCFVGVGTVGSHSVDDIEGFESCSVSTEISDDQRVVTYAGLSEKMNTSCVEAGVNGTKNRLCYCNEDLCNSNADRYRAVLVEIVESFASWVESLFDDADDDESSKTSSAIKEQCDVAGYVARNRTKWEKFVSYISNHKKWGN